MPFFQFLGGLVVGKAIIKVGGQSIFFCGLFGNDFFELVTGFVRSLDFKKWGIADTMKAKRADLIANFKKQQRLDPKRVLEKYKGALDRTALKDMYNKEKDVAPIVSRVMKEWDANKDGKLGLEEIAGAISKTDGKMSLSSLDPGAPGSMATMLFKGAWSLLLVALVFFFAKGILEHFAQSEEEEEKASSKKKK
jgi:hypothetical protein